MNDADPLAQLRDIHLPRAIDWWPPAPGWWLLAVLMLVGLVVLCWWLVRRHHAHAYRRQARGELDTAFSNWQADSDTTVYLQTVNAVLKRVALHSYQRETVARLSGSAWSAFLDTGTAATDFADAGISEALYGAGASPCDAGRIHQVSVAWVKQHRGEPC